MNVTVDSHLHVHAILMRGVNSFAHLHVLVNSFTEVLLNFSKKIFKVLNSEKKCLVEGNLWCV